MRQIKPHLITLLAATALLSGCASINPFGSSEAPPLPGERVSVLELQKELEPDRGAQAAQDAFVAPQAWQNELWPQRGGYPSHAMQNLSFNEGAFQQIWSVSIGSGTSSTNPLSIAPILADGKLFTLSPKLEAKAFDPADGKQLWSLSLKPKSEDEIAIGGGLSYGDGLLFAVTGFNTCLALSPETGEILWQKDLPAPARAAPTVLNGHLYVQLIDNQLLALDSHSGLEIWRYTGFTAESGLLGAASPAANQDLVVAAFSSGELTGLNAQNGTVIWSDSLAPRRRSGGISSVSDITGLPVIDRDLVIAAGFGGRMLALNAENGRRVWQRDIGSLETPWVANNQIFSITTDQKLVSLDRNTGAVIWVTDLDKIQKDDEEVWVGPLLAGSRLILASSAGQIAEIQPQDGQVIRTSKAAGRVTSAPFVANGTLYVLSDNGKLSAYR